MAAFKWNGWQLWRGMGGRFALEYASWARLFIDDTFYYAFLYMAAGYIYDKLDQIGYDKINKLIPIELIEGPEHGKKEKDGTVWDMIWDYKGRETQYEELKKRYTQYIEERHSILAKEFDKNPQKQVYLIEGNQNEPNMNFVFSDKTVLQAVRFRNFMSDCRQWLGNPSELEDIIEQEKQAAVRYIEEAYFI